MVSCHYCPDERCPCGGPTPVLHLSNLHGVLTIIGAPGDRFALEGTVTGAIRTVLSNPSNTRGSVYALRTERRDV